MNISSISKNQLFYYLNILAFLYQRPTPIPPQMSLIQLLKKELPGVFEMVPY